MGISIKRRISYKDIAGITMSKTSHEFVIHVPSEYDYRFDSPDKRNEIISITIRNYQEEKRKQLAFWFVEDISLVKY
jgi:serum/glucocorticoid-regulated kinase 2